VTRIRPIFYNEVQQFDEDEEIECVFPNEERTRLNLVKESYREKIFRFDYILTPEDQ